MFKIEGEWSGYSNPASSGQNRIVHLEYTTDKALAEACRGRWITYTDGTTLRLIVTEVSRRGDDQRISYSSLIRQCVDEGVWEVAKLSDVQATKNQ